MSQLSMFDVAPVQPASVRRPLVAPVQDVEATISERLAYDPDGPTVATYAAEVDNPHWPHLKTSGLVVRVEKRVARRPVTWMASVGLELPDEDRTWWSAFAVCATQDEAAAEAADMARVARALLVASARGEPVETPGQRRQRAAEAYADALPEVREAFEAVDAAIATRAEIGAFNDGHPGAHQRYLVAKARAVETRQRALDAFCASHPWQEFAADWFGGGDR